MADVGDTGRIDRSRVEVVAKLMAKAVSTEHDAETAALVERSYGLLARVLSDYELNGGGAAGARRRERRLIRDRRRAQRDRLYGTGSSGSPVVSATDGTERYREIAQDTDRRHDGDGDDGRGKPLSL
jgi:hypothetical protein